jgi:hypothetical protein
MAWIALWPLAPALAALQARWTGGMFYSALALALLLGLNVIFRALKSASGLSFNRMLLVMVVIVIYISCFMYLWVG